MKNIKIYAFADEASPSIDEQIVAMKKNGLDGLEIRNVDGENVSSISFEKAKEVKAKMDAAGLKVWSIGSPIGKIMMEGGDWPAEQERFLHTLEIAKILGAENIRMFSFYGCDEKPDEYRDEVMNRLKWYVEAAKPYGVCLCHENEKGIYGDIASRCLDIFKTVPELKCVFDPANFVQCGQDTLEAWEMLKGYVKYLHIKDALSDGNVVPAGKGIGNVKAILDDFDGECVTIEPHLTVFSGLADLEQEGDKSVVGQVYTYSSNEEAFDAACEALKGLI